MAKTRASCFRGLKIAAAVLMAVGVLVLACNLPGWVWGSALGIILISIGFLVWRFL